MMKAKLRITLVFAASICASTQTQALAEDLETHSLKINSGIKQAEADVGTLRADILDAKAYQNYNRYFTFGLGFRQYSYTKDGKITGGDGTDLTLDAIANTPKLQAAGINLGGYLKAAQTLYSDHSYKVAYSPETKYDSSDFSRSSTTLSVGLSIGPKWSYIYEYAITAEYGVAAENLTNRKAYVAGNESKQNKPGNQRMTGREFLVGIQLTH